MARRLLYLVPLLALPLLAASASAADSDEHGVLLGRVSTESEPLGTALVYAYQLADLSFQRTVTDLQGNFLFDDLPAGLYKIIAFKQGFVPAVVFLSRVSARAQQFLQLQLNAQTTTAANGDPDADGEDFWSIRQRIPGDVLRDVEVAGFDAQPTSYVADGGGQGVDVVSFKAEMLALTGVQNDADLGNGQLTGGRVDLLGQYHGLQVGVVGNFLELAPGDFESGARFAAGQARALTVNVERGSDTRFSLTSLDNHLAAPLQAEGNVDFAQYRFQWNQDFGRSGRSEVAARYVDESNFYRSGFFDPMGIPMASRSLHVEGSYENSLGARSTINAGLRYRARDTQYSPLDIAQSDLTLLPEQRVDLFGSSGLQVRPSMLVEYGLYSTLQDGTVSLAPRGEMVLQLGPHWQALTAASHRVDTTSTEGVRDFFATYRGDLETCERLDDYCYQVLFTRPWGDGEDLSFGAIHRKFAETLRLYFSEDFFDHLESLYLVEGDSLPELQFAMTRRLSPQILTRLESNVAAGGGGLLHAADDQTYENRVRYMVTSLDTRFERTSTGVFLAFHHLDQRLQPLDGVAGSAPEVQRERLQLIVTQDLDWLRSLASRLAVQVNMELSRGTTPEDLSRDDSELMKRFMGGVAVKF